MGMPSPPTRSLGVGLKAVENSAESKRNGRRRGWSAPAYSTPASFSLSSTTCSLGLKLFSEIGKGWNSYATQPSPDATHQE